MSRYQNNAGNIATVQRCAIQSTFLIIEFVENSQVGSKKILKKKFGWGFGVVKYHHHLRDGMCELI